MTGRELLRTLLPARGLSVAASPCRRLCETGEVASRTWRDDWDELRAGKRCAACTDGRPDEDRHGARYFASAHGDAYLQRTTPAPGYSVVVFRGRHVADPTELSPRETVAFWSAVRVAARAIQEVFAPCHLNYQLLGNAMPHVHVHIVPRYLNDPAPARPLGDEVWSSATTLPTETLAEQVAALVAAAQSFAAAPPPEE